MPLTISVIWLALVVWLILRALRQRDALLSLLPLKTQKEHASIIAPHVAIIIPARDESNNIGPCLHSVLGQNYPPERLRINVVDDDSNDNTAAIVKAAARLDPRITLCVTPPLPPAWKGKVNACCAGVRALDPHIEWICFIDADMRVEPELIRGALAAAISNELDLLSLAPRHELCTFAERLMIPCGLYVLSFTQRLRRIQAPDSGEVVANGQFMLFRRKAYDQVGGHHAVSTATCEDVEIARLLKRNGYRVLLMDGSRFLSTRMYQGWRTLWPGFAKNLTHMLGGFASTVGMIFIALTLSWAAVLLPLIDSWNCAKGLSQACIATIPATLGSFAAFGLHIAGTVYFRIPAWYGMLFPLGYTIGAVIALDSLRWRVSGRIYWKGRVYDE